MTEDPLAEVRQRLRALGNQFREGLEQINSESTLSRAMPPPTDGDRRRRGQPDPAARLKRLGEELRARRRQQIMHALATVAFIGFTAGWLGGRVSARAALDRRRAG